MYVGKSKTRWFTVEAAADLLRVNKESIYRNLDEIPHIRFGRDIRIPCEFLLLEPPVERMCRIDVRHERWFKQLELPFEVPAQRRWRNGARGFRRLVQRHS